MGVCPNALLSALDSDLESESNASGVQLVAIKTLRSVFLKKWKGKIAGHNSREKALSMFKERATYCRLFNRAPFAKGFLHLHMDSTPDVDAVAEGVRYSSGSSLNMAEKSTSGYAKHNLQRPSVTSAAVYDEFAGLLRDHNKPLFRDLLWREQIYGGFVESPSSRITTVPKTYQIDRVIAVEPTINGFLQQGVKHSLEKILSRAGIDLSSQPDTNRAMARLGSLGHGFSTIDLSAASDSISKRLLQYLLPTAWYEYISFVSSPSFTLDGEVIEANEIALTMGNAITFPLQTLIFLSLCYEAYARIGERFSVNETVAVFGDDIICTDRAYATVLQVLEEMGFDPNPDKCFGSGEFRESCGADWYCGINVRGVYITRLSTIGDVFVARNLLAAWAHRWSVDLSQSLRLLDIWLASRKALQLVPPCAAIDSGIRVFDPVPGSFSTEDYSYYYSGRFVKYKKRSIARYKASPFANVQASLAGYTSEGRLNERPLSGGKFVISRLRSPFWAVDWSDRATSWLYDVSRTTAGNLPDLQD